MAIELSNLTFTEQDDIVPASGVEQIFNSYRRVANTLLGNDTITGIGSLDYNDPTSNYGIFNSGTLDMAEGKDVITGTTYGTGIYNSGTLDMAEGNDVISGTATNSGIINTGILDTAEGDDIITADGQGAVGFNNIGTFNTGEGDDIIIGDGNYLGITNGGNFDTGDGNDRIRGISDIGLIYAYGIFNSSFTFNTGDGNDTIDGSGYYGIINRGLINTGNGQDIIIAKGINDGGARGLSNFSTIDTGDNDDIIIGTGGIYNEGVINTGNGNDSIIANEGFKSGSNSRGRVFLGNGEDYIKGFGSGDFYGGNGNDRLELTPGSYSVGREGATVALSKDNSLMLASEFEQLIAGSTIYDFTSLTAGQIIVVA